MRDWLAVACEASVRRRALKVAVIVGVILALINHGDALFAGQMTAVVWFKIAMTFLVPYCVSTFAAVQAIRQQRSTTKGE